MAYSRSLAKVEDIGILTEALHDLQKLNQDKPHIFIGLQQPNGYTYFAIPEEEAVTEPGSGCYILERHNVLFLEQRIQKLNESLYASSTDC